MNDKIEQLKKKWSDEESQEQIDNWSSVLRNQAVVTDLYKNQAVQVLLDKLRNNIDIINERLQTNEMLSDRERDKLFVEKRCWAWLQQFFDTSKNIISSTEKQIDDALK